ncbi:MAG: hypothetical protein RLO01_06080 [Thalassobaculaceae bacterium]
MTDDRVIPLRPAGRAAATDAPLDAPVDAPPAPQPETARLTVGVELPADRRSVLMVQTIAQLATLAKEAGVPLDDGLAEGAERLARNLRGAGLALPPHLEDALEEITLALSPPEPERDGGIVVPFRAGPSDD